MNGVRENRQSPVRHPAVLRGVLLGAAALLGVLFLFGIYRMARQTASRVSADYYFPFLKSARGTENWIADQTLLLQNKRTLARALQNLRAENALLAAERSIIADLKKENESLRALMQLKPRDGFRPVFAEVIQRDPMVWQEEFSIDKGAHAGIRPGNLVVVQVFSGRKDSLVPAVIGRVRSVEKHTARVSTVLSRDFRLYVSLTGTKLSGLLESSHPLSELYAKLKYVQADQPPVSGQLVCTNSLSGESPPGLPVGRIAFPGGSGRTSRGNRMYLEACVEPFVSPSEVRFVAVYVKDGK